MITLNKIKFLTIFSIIMLTASLVFGANIVLDNPVAKKSEQATVNVTLEGNPANIDGSGAAFTVIHDPEIVLTSVESTFFDTFQAQFQQAQTPEPYSTSVDGYDQPLVINNDNGKAMIAAARCTATENTNILFKLKFNLVSGQPVGTYDVKIKPTTLNNTSAGYSADGETIPILVGSDPTKSYTSDDAYPTIIDDAVDNEGLSTHVTHGTVTFKDDECTDSDNDTLCDDWEIANFGDLSKTAEEDTDQGGLPNGEEEEAGKDPNNPDDDLIIPIDDCVNPIWTAKTGLLNNMTVYGNATVDGTIKAEGFIAAFGPNGEDDIRAVEAIDANGNYYILIGGDTNGEEITFQLQYPNYEENECQILTTSTKVNFTADSTIGNTALDFTKPVLTRTIEIELVQGWNWVSFNVMPEDNSVEAFFGDNSAKVAEIKNQTQGATNLGALWIGQKDLLQDIAKGVMFKIKAKEAFTLVVTGTPVDATTPISLYNGWTWLGYLPITCIETRTAIDSVFSTLLEVKSQTQGKSKLSDTLFIGNLENMCEGVGYAIKNNAEATLIYPQQ